MTLKEYLETRDNATFGRSIRIIDDVTRKNRGSVIENFSAIVISVKVTSKYLFIFVKKY